MIYSQLKRICYQAFAINCLVIVYILAERNTMAHPKVIRLKIKTIQILVFHNEIDIVFMNKYMADQHLSPDSAVYSRLT